ncbi:MAG: U32 family peptidase [Candidatus Omnitrophota bacterium]
MKFSIPTNWDDRLVERINKERVGEFYGKLYSDSVGGGRASFLCSPVDRKKAVRHIRIIRGAGIRFNYLLNAACLGNKEFTTSWHRQLRKLLGWLADNGVDTVTVAVPFLLDLVKSFHPEMRVSVSAFAHINTVRKALFWESRGADEITPSPTELNRDFKTLQEMRKRLSCGLKLIVNNNCLLDCPLHFYHSAISAHASRKEEPAEGFMIDYCRVQCRYLRLIDPENFLKADWIRPEDTALYERIGVHSFKIVDRVLSTEAILMISSAYFAQRHDGNLLELFPMTKDIVVFQHHKAARFLKYFFRPGLINPLKLLSLRKLIKPIDVFIDNRALDGFIERVKDRCSPGDFCRGCACCAETAEKAVRVSSRGLKEAVDSYKVFLQKISGGDLWEI